MSYMYVLNLALDRTRVLPSLQSLSISLSLPHATAPRPFIQDLGYRCSTLRQDTVSPAASLALSRDKEKADGPAL